MNNIVYNFPQLVKEKITDFHKQHFKIKTYNIFYTNYLTLLQIFSIVLISLFFTK